MIEVNHHHDQKRGQKQRVHEGTPVQAEFIDDPEIAHSVQAFH